MVFVIKKTEKINIDALAERIPLICSEYNVCGKVVERKTSDTAAEPEHYILVGMGDVPSSVDPKAIADRSERSFLLFYPHCFALKINEDTNPLKLIDKTVEYCKEAEFIKALFNEFKCEIPEVIRVDELYSLKRFNDQRHNKRLNAEGKKRFHLGLQRFFKKEKTKSRHKKAWKKHYRSERFDENAPVIKQYLNFFRRNDPEISLKVLQQSCDNLKLTVMNENEYRYFKKQMKKLYPDISYSASPKWEVDHGLIKVPKGEENPFGECVTYEEYFKMREETFSQSGYAALENINVSRWEFRNITYRSVDESIIASVLSPYRFGYVKDSQLSTVLSFGESNVISIPSGEMMNFYSLAMSYGLPFYVDDHNQYKDASLDYVHIVYSRASQNAINEILNRLVGDKITGSHMITEKQRRKHLLSNQINDAISTAEQEQKKGSRLPKPQTSRDADLKQL